MVKPDEVAVVERSSLVNLFRQATSTPFGDALYFDRLVAKLAFTGAADRPSDHRRAAGLSVYSTRPPSSF